MERWWEFLQSFVAQFAGGPGAPENNLVRFGLAAIMWAALLLIAWNRQREAVRPRERLLLAGFALALFRELFMLSHISLQVLRGTEHTSLCLIVIPIEHALTLAAIVLISGAFIRYILDDLPLTRRYMRLGLGATALVLAYTFISWPQQIATTPSVRFHETTAAVFIQLAGTLLLLTAIFVLARERGWLRNVVLLALGFFLISQVMVLVNYLTGRAYSQVLCPIGNSFYLWGIPLFGFVYLREQSAEKRRAEEALAAYRNHLEELVDHRTAALRNANLQLQREVEERSRAEAKIARRNAELATQIAIAGTISQSLNLNTILDSALRRTVSLLDMDAGCVVLFAAGSEAIELQITTEGEVAAEYFGRVHEGRLCESLARQVTAELAPKVWQQSGSQAYSPVLAADSPFRMLVSTPLVVHGSGLGALTFASKTLSDLPPEELDLMRAIGQQIGVAVENARLYRQVERWASGMARLNELSLSLNATLDPAAIYRLIAHQAARLLACPVAIFYRWDEEKGRAREVSSYGVRLSTEESCSLLPADSAALADLLSGFGPLQIEASAQSEGLPNSCLARVGERSFLALAVRRTSAPLGFLFLGAGSARRRWSLDEIELLERFADRAATALENAYVHRQLEWAAALEERQRIAAEMHDGLAQTLSYVNLKLDRAHELLERGQVAAVLDHIVELQTTIDQANDDVRASIATLRESPPPRRSLQQVLQETALQREQDRWPAVVLESKLTAPLFPTPDDLEQVNRVVKEAIVNAHRHGQAQEIRIILFEQNAWYRLEIVDDGCGFQPDGLEAQGRGHFGLSIMRARAARLGGNLAVDSHPGQGTTVALSWPVPDAGSAEVTVFPSGLATGAPSLPEMKDLP